LIDVVLVLKFKSVWVLFRLRLKCMLDGEMIETIDFEEGEIGEDM
jgi:hypothetical protein